MKTFKVFEHINNQPTKEMEFTECDSASEVVDLIHKNVEQILKANNADINEEYISADLSNIHSAGHATTFSIFTSVIDSKNEKHTQEIFHYTVVEIQG